MLIVIIIILAVVRLQRSRLGRSLCYTPPPALLSR